MSARHRMGALRPSRQRWRTWQQQEPALRQLTYRDLRDLLSTRGQEMQRRHDELLTAIVRLAKQGDEAAGEVLIDCLEPGLRRRAVRYKAGLTIDEARAELNLGLWEAVTRFDTTRSLHVASRLLDRACDRLRRKARADLVYQSRVIVTGDGYFSRQPGAADLDDGELAELVVSFVAAAGVPSTIDAALVAAVDIEGLRLRDAAHLLGLGYEAAKKRCQRARRRLARCWSDVKQLESASCRQHVPVDGPPGCP